MNTALYTGTFDPLTNRHLWMIATGILLFDRIVVVVAIDPPHETMFTFEERLELARQCAEMIHPERITVIGMERRFLAQCAQQNKCRFLLRRMPSRQEYDQEVTLQHENFSLSRSIRLVYLAPDAEVAGTTSGVVRSLVGTENWHETVKAHVCVPVWEALLSKAKKVNRPG